MSITMELEASERLFMASAVIAIEPVIIPTNSFSANKIIFEKIPHMPESLPIALLTLGSSVFSLFRTNKRKISFVIKLSFAFSLLSFIEIIVLCQ